MYRALRSDPTWGLVTQLLVTTRSYDTGLELALALLVVADRYEALRPAHEAARFPVPLYSLLLDMLDRLDEPPPRRSDRISPGGESCPPGAGGKSLSRVKPASHLLVQHVAQPGDL